MKKYLLLILLLHRIILCNGEDVRDSRMDRFIDDLMKKMTLEEKLGQLNLITLGYGPLTGSTTTSGPVLKVKNGQVGAILGTSGPAAARKVQEAALSSRLKIPLIFGLDVIHGHKTIFPIPLGLSCTWDPEMAERSARIAATEASADGLNWVYSPMVDISRDPRWGRVAEGAGEDPYLGSLMAAAMVKGYQGPGYRDSAGVMACVKHFALYGAAEAGRDYNSVDMSLLKMYQDYLPPYKAAVDAGVGSVMTSFNDINGTPATANRWLLTDLLRKQWGFKGFVVTDYTAIKELSNHGLGDLQQVSALALKAGVDMEMVGEGMVNTLARSLKEGKVTLPEIDQACRRVLEAKYKMGLFEDPYRHINEARATRELVKPANLALAREVARKSIVLLKNHDQVLPLKKSGTIAVIGPLADSPDDMLGTWVIVPDRDKIVPILQGIKNAAGNNASVLFAKGANFTNDPLLSKAAAFYGVTSVNQSGEEIEKASRQMLSEALDVSSKADVIVAVLGEQAAWSGEASSRSDISIPESQKTLLTKLLETGKPVVLVLVNGRPLTLEWEDSHVSAILETWNGGTEAGNAIADVLFGDFNPSGKLTMTFPRNIGQIPVYYNHKNTGRPLDPKDKFTSKYLDVSNEPLYPFGYGLSYTTFSYGETSVSKAGLSGNETLTISTTVTNTGKYPGEEIVQLYIWDPVATITRPVKELKKFSKISLRPGENKAVSFTLTREDLKFWNADLKYVFEPGEFIIYVGNNSRDVKEVKVNWQ
jgi:beta-glucosidase